MFFAAPAGAVPGFRAAAAFRLEGAIEPMDALDTPDHDAVLSAISTVMDPEAGMNVVDLGLIYGVDIDGDKVMVTMTMTTPTCPVGDYLRDAVRDAVRDRFPSLALVDVELTFDPPWTPDKMSDAARAKFGW